MRSPSLTVDPCTPPGIIVIRIEVSEHNVGVYFFVCTSFVEKKKSHSVRKKEALGENELFLCVEQNDSIRFLNSLTDLALAFVAFLFRNVNISNHYI